MNLHHLRVFATIAHEGSITAAARALHVSQPAVSKQLADFERDLDLGLFDRLSRGVRLTAAGQVLLGHADRLFAAEAAAETDLERLRGLRFGHLSIGASTTIGSYLVPAVFGAFHRAHPEVELELEIANTAAIQDAVLGGRIDLGLTEGFVSSEALEVEVVYRDELVLIAPPDHPLAGGDPVEPAVLRDVPFICREQGSGTRDVIEAALAEAGLPDLDPSLTLGSTEAVKHAVSGGLGVSFVSRLTVELELASERIAVVPVRGLRIDRALHLVTLHDKSASPAAAAFIELLRRQEGPSPHPS